MLNSLQFKYRGQVYECIGNDKEFNEFNHSQFMFALESKQYSVVKNRITNQLMWGPLIKKV